MRGSADDRFDFIEGITYMPQSATLFLPHRRPFDTVPKGLGDGSQMAFPQLADNSQKERRSRATGR